VQPEERTRTLSEVLIAFAVVTALASILYHLPGVGIIRANLQAIVASLFILVPLYLLRDRGSIERYGFTTHPRKLGGLVLAAWVCLSLPLFVGLFYAYHRILCVVAPAWVAGSCYRLLHPIFRVPHDFSMLAAAQVLVVGLPEELFFRGYIQGRLEDAWPPGRSLWGAPVGKAWLVGALLFALGHYLVTFEPQMLSRFFPGLAFGWMYARTRSILAGTIFHALCNLLMEFLVLGFLM
jgi:uncharacterized protein